jgi:hypothetical protein
MQTCWPQKPVWETTWEFKSPYRHDFRAVVQLVERAVRDGEVACSNQVSSTERKTGASVAPTEDLAFEGLPRLVLSPCQGGGMEDAPG